MRPCICETADYAPAHTTRVENPNGSLAGYLCFHCETLWVSA